MTLGHSCDPIHSVIASRPAQLIDWFPEGQLLAVEFGGLVVTVKYVNRKGRRARIAVTGPAGTTFRVIEPSRRDS